MNTLWVVVLGALTIILAYNLYAKRIDREVIQSNPKRATPAKMYMDGVDFMPTSRSVLYGYHFKSIAAAGPIVGVITAANIWGWAPSILWLILGVSFIGWAADYSAVMISVRNDGNSLSAISYKLIAPRTRTILFIFIFFYLLLVAAAFLGIMTALMDARPDVPLGILALAIMGLLGGQMLYRWKIDLILVTIVIVVVTLAAMLLGPAGQAFNAQGAVTAQGPVGQVVVAINNAMDKISGGHGILTTVDPTKSDPRLSNPNLADAKTGLIKMMPSYLLWALFLLVFSYLGANLPIWRFAQPVNYIGFWIMLIAIVLSAIGAILGPFTAPNVATFTLKAWKGFAPPQAAVAGGLAPIQPLWPMLFVTIACGAISGWHSLIGPVGTARQLEYETDGLPVGGGAMFGENTLALLSLTAVAIAGGAGAGAFAAGVGQLIKVATFGAVPLPFGTALGFGAFMVIVLTVVQLVFRVMRVTLSEWVGEVFPAVRNMHVSTIISMILTLILVLSGTWVYLWQLFGASNQLMAALSLLVVTVWLKSENRNPAYALWPMLFMYITTIVSTVVTAYNLWVTIIVNPVTNSQFISVAGAWAMICVAILLIVAALFIGWDGLQAYRRYRTKPLVQATAAAGK